MTTTTQTQTRASVITQTQDRHPTTQAGWHRIAAGTPVLRLSGRWAPNTNVEAAATWGVVLDDGRFLDADWTSSNVRSRPGAKTPEGDARLLFRRAVAQANAAGIEVQWRDDDRADNLGCGRCGETRFLNPRCQACWRPAESR